MTDVLGASDLAREVCAIEERVDLDGGGGAVGQSALGTLAGGAEAAKGAGIAGDVLGAC